MQLHIKLVLDILYRERIIHKDIKPANILINPETKEVKLIDFSIASLLPRETQTLINPNVLEGTLAYISPEQTGRMNRLIDYRTDFYSLGVTFYELLTGELPFQSNEPMELVHSHIAKLPPSLREVKSQKSKGASVLGGSADLKQLAFKSEEIPQVLSDIVMKLMTKNAESRYQSALGLKFDLQNCLHQLQLSGIIKNFEIASRDVCDRFIIPEKLYGRETEVNQLLTAFERVSIGSTEMMLVAGFSGIGKTAVVNEVHKPIVRQRGYFIKGKYDQFQRNIPFSAFVQAFRNLMGQLLCESDAQLQSWKTQILAAVGDNGQVLIDVIPELENIIGSQPRATELSGSAAQNRFNLLLPKFVQIFTSIEHPLVMFLDDLQWADSASLNLLKLLMLETGHLLILGAYRDNEVSPAHPFILTVDELVKTGARVNTITLSPLSLVDMNQLVVDTLNCKLSQAQPLTELVYKKTQGNPFFATQFLKALHDDKLISFNWEIQHWQCDLAQVEALAITDDVVEFMALQLDKLPTQTQEMLKLAACIGAQFDLNTLVIVSEKSAVNTATALWKALQEGLVIPTTKIYKFFTQSDSEEALNASANPTYRFLHDRVQQAAYSLIPEQQKIATHLKMGQLLQEKFSNIEQEEKLFDIVGHLNRGIELITQPEEREALAQLNLKAGSKARSSTAYSSARIYLQTGMDLLRSDCWQSQYELTLNFYVAATEAAYLNGNFDGMEEMAALVLQEAQTILDKVKTYELLIAARSAQSKHLEAFTVGINALGQLGLEFPSAPDEASIDRALQTLANLMKGRKIEELVDLPVMTDAKTQATMQLLSILDTPIFQTMAELLPVLSSTMVSLSLQFGNAPASTAGYSLHGMVLCAFFGEVEIGYSFGQLALNLLERLNAREFKCLVLAHFGTFIQHQKEALRATIPTLKDGYTAGMETGDFLNGSYSILAYSYMKFLAGVELDTWEIELAGYNTALAQMKQYSVQAALEITQQTVQNLRETVSQPDCLIGQACDEIVMIPKYRQDNELSSLAQVYILKLLLAYIWGNYTAALDNITQAKQYLMGVPAMVFVPIFHFYAALTHLALFPTQPEQEQAEIIAEVETHQTTLHQWAQNAPMNYVHKCHLVEAQKQRVLGNKAEAIDLYDRAIAGAKANGYIQEEALANELAAKFYLAWGKQRIAEDYMIGAYYGYARWGAKAKVADLEIRYPQLLAPILQQTRSPLSTNETIFTLGSVTSTSGETSSSSSISVALDLAAILKASQTLSGEIEFEKLLSSLLSIVIKNAGADKCVFMLLRDSRLSIEGSITEGSKPIVLQRLPIEDSQDIPLRLIYKVKHDRQTVVLFDAATDRTLANDPYIIRQQPHSILCSPILHQGKLLGILYLENNLATGAFTSDRVELLNLLCAQAAISLENARLYAQEQKKSLLLEQALTDLQNAQLQMVQSEKMSALGNLVAGVAHEMNNPLGFISASLEQAKPTFTDIIEHLKLYQEIFPNKSKEIKDHESEIDLEYSLEDLPNMLDSMSMACNRLKNISTSLRTFSRADRDYKVRFDIHEGIDSTILILKHRLKANDSRPAIEIVTDYGNLPQIKCFPGQLNQVFMNLIANAIDALDELNIGRSFQEIKANPNLIKITTSLKEKQVEVKIADNGQGMSESVRQKVFDHLFTTKGVGKGTGLGLAIAQSIVVEKHGGTLNVNSTPGVGTEFVITLSILV
ncbi:MAG: AAA family ATPase [Nostoc sp.]|uniref:trifunctional serine/threonine-protein kinase/ATP-binding protein/sensor histidine kinase n=1 Tax=Nostoc sp. TaxID=1180 RepID=UPI002FF5CE43